MSTILKNQATLQEAEDFIIACGNTNPTMLVGQPGVGKTAMFDRIVERTGFRGVYMNVPELDLGDIGIPMPNHENKTTTLYPSEAWAFIQVSLLLSSWTSSLKVPSQSRMFCTR